LKFDFCTYDERMCSRVIKWNFNDNIMWRNFIIKLWRVLNTIFELNFHEFSMLCMSVCLPYFMRQLISLQMFAIPCFRFSILIILKHNKPNNRSSNKNLLLLFSFCKMNIQFTSRISISLPLKVSIAFLRYLVVKGKSF
jgi:hypothetical protein